MFLKTAVVTYLFTSKPLPGAQEIRELLQCTWQHLQVPWLHVILISGGKTNVGEDSKMQNNTKYHLS